MKQRIIIMAGGTGGHIFPALAVAQYLIERDWQVSWLGTKRGMENRIVPDNHIKLNYLSVQGLRGKSLLTTLNNGMLLIKSLFQAFVIFRAEKPDVVIGFGGYVAGPGGMIASLMGIPLIVHEQNQVVGTTNRLLMQRANQLLQAFPNSFPEKSGAILTGNPLRSEFLSYHIDKAIWTAALGRNFRILVVGGSQGAQVLNELIPQVIDEGMEIDIIHQTGSNAYQAVVESYQKTTMNTQVMPFIDDMLSAYQWADMIICRSGAMTVSEVTAVALPALFIPLPYAIDDHQTANARYIADAGGAILLAQADMNKTSLLTAIKQIQTSLMEMHLVMQQKACLDATVQVAAYCIQEAKDG